MTPHNALVDRCTALVMDEDIFVQAYEARKIVRAVLAEVLRTMGTVTPEMVLAWDDERTPDEIAFPTSEQYASGAWLAMLRASTLTPS